MIPYRIVRTFAPDGSDDVRALARTLELPTTPAPQRGQDILLPGAAEPLRIARVTLTARPPAGPHGWEPGFKSLEWVEVELEPEPAAGYEAALAGGWTPAP